MFKLVVNVLLKFNFNSRYSDEWQANFYISNFVIWVFFIRKQEKCSMQNIFFLGLKFKNSFKTIEFNLINCRLI
jgi:hypothetical protein